LDFSRNVFVVFVNSLENTKKREMFLQINYVVFTFSAALLGPTAHPAGRQQKEVEDPVGR
jgi:hypothetical protein